MKRLRIEHRTEYVFGAPVLLGPHRLRVRPRESHELRIVGSSLRIHPEAEVRWQRDALDNSVALVEFRGVSDRLVVVSTVELEHYEEAPLDFLVDASAVSHPFAYGGDDRIDLAAFLGASWPDDRDAVRSFLLGLGLLGVRHETFALLDRLNRAIRADFAYEVREEEGVRAPAHTLALRRGSCRDFAALFVDACRELGLAARFVSGYLHAPATEAGSAATHAWAEVYLPGPGWKGFDPTIGTLVGDDHIAVAVARHAEAVPPIAGSFVGPSGLVATMFVGVRVQAL